MISSYFSSPQTSKISEVLEEESLNPFKTRKITKHKNKDTNDDLNTSLNSDHINEGDILQCLENEEVSKKTLNKKLPNLTQTAFNWKSYSNNRMVTNKEIHNEEQKFQNSSNDTFSVIDDIKRVRMLAYMQWSRIR